MSLFDRIAKIDVRNTLTIIPGTTSQLPKVNPLSEIGVTGLLRTSGTGFVYDEWLAALSTYRAKQVYREMRDNDAVVGAMFFALEMILRKANWIVKPAETKKGEFTADFIKECMEDMSHTWEDFISENVSMFTFGFSLFETVYKRRKGPDGRQASKFDDGLIGWRKFAPRSQESILYWMWDDEGGLQGAVQLAAPDYRTVPIPIEKLLLFRTTSIKGNPEGRSVLRNAFRCFDSETEILTKQGWMNGLDLMGEEEVAVLSPDGFLQYEVPSATPRYEYNGELLHFESKYLNQAVTPNHELWVTKYGKQEYKRVLATDVSLSNQIKRDANWKGKEEKTHTVPAYVWKTEQNGRHHICDARPAIEVPMDDWLRFLGIWIAEGGCSLPDSRAGVVSVSQNKGKKANKIKRWMDKLPFNIYVHDCSEAKLSFEICNRQLWDHMRHLGKTLDKFVPDYVKNLSSRQIKIFLDAFHLGDGGGGINGPDGRDLTKTYITASDKLADDLCELVLKSGMCPTKRRVHIPEWKPADWKSRNRTEPYKEYTPYVDEHEVWVISQGKHNDCRIKKIYREKYKGLVWCVTTKAGVVYVRRKGKCQWSGNSWFFKRRIEEVEGIGIERDLCGIPVLYASAEAIAAMGGIDVATKLVTNIRVDDQMGVVIPMAYDEKGNPLVKLELLKAAGSKQTDPGGAIQRYNSDMLNTIMAGFIQMGQTPTGSFSLHMSASQIFEHAIGAYMESTAAVINRIAIPRLMELNNMDPEDAPTLVPGELGKRDLDSLGGWVQKLSMAGLTFIDPKTQNYLRKVSDLPELDEDDPALQPPQPPMAPGQQPVDHMGNPIPPKPGMPGQKLPPTPPANQGNQPQQAQTPPPAKSWGGKPPVPNGKPPAPKAGANT